jgi:hypothetical protein
MTMCTRIILYASSMPLSVGEPDLAELGFDGVVATATGRPAYHPAVLLKIYISAVPITIHRTLSCAARSDHNVVEAQVSAMVPVTEIRAAYGVTYISKLRQPEW